MGNITPINQPEQSFLSIEQVAARLHRDVNWVREKIRRRCSNPMPVHNVGRHLLFEWTGGGGMGSAIRRRPAHAAHKRAKAGRESGLAPGHRGEHA